MRLVLHTGWCILLCFISAVSLAQSKKELTEMGDKSFDKGNYASAVYFYSKVVKGSSGRYDVTYPYEINSWSGTKKVKSGEGEEQLSPSEKRQQYAIHRLADSYRLLRDYENAILWYSKAVQMPHENFPQSLYWYGTMQMCVQKYGEAAATFQKYMDTKGEEDEYYLYAADKQVSCEFALDPKNTLDGVDLKKMDSTFNSGTASFAPAFYEGELSLIFSSGRDGNVNDDPKNKQSKFLSDLFVTTYLGDTYDTPRRFEAPVSTGNHEGSAALSTDRTTFYFTRWTDDDKQNAHIYVTKKFNNRWMEPLMLDAKVNVEGYRSINPSLDLDETRLYFASDRPGGYGGLDIWYCPIDEYGNIGDPINLGAGINTREDEMSPFHHYQSNTLFFSSRGHIGFGGYDIFRTKYEEDNDSWTNPVNIGAPYNSSKDDTYFIIDKNMKNGFLTSDRDRCADCDTTMISGYCNKIFGFAKPDIHVSINGYVFDSETGDVIPNALISFKDIKGSFAPFFVMTDDEGYYERDLEYGWDIFMKAQKSKYFGDAATVFTSGLTESTVLTQDFYLNRIPEGEITIEGIEYDFDKATLRPKSKEILDKLFDFLSLNNNLTIEIQSHTDSRGNDAYNLDLSERRAQSVVDYLVDKGIPRERMIPKGYGETTPAPKLDADGNPDKDANGEVIRLTEPYIYSIKDEKLREEYHQRNRRTAFKVLSEDNQVLKETNNQ
jgi:outer membrane protein OmpA-like peptidoglycan-associated protein/tetratricopeptide (TPR) repeat protein